MTYCSVSRSALSGAVRCPPSKSYTHRAVFLAALADSGGGRVSNVLRSADTDATIEACRRLGASIRAEASDGNGTEAGTLTVTDTIRKVRGRVGAAARAGDAGVDGGGHDAGGGGGDDEEVIRIDAANSGTTIRVAAGVAALLDGRVELTGDSSLRTRPMQPLLDALSAMGASCSSADGRPPLRIRGPIRGGAVEISGNVSSQFVTSLFLCAPKTDSGMSITIKGGMVSRPYLESTISAMREFGVSVQTQVPYKRYRIAPQRISPPAGGFAVPSDASSLALLLAAAALNDGNVAVEAQMGALPQGDEAFIDMLESMGASIEITDTAGGETVRVGMPDGGLRGAKFDLGNHPDLLPPLAIMALGCGGSLEISNVGHARLKETDRISILARELPKLGVDIDEREDGLVADASASAPRGGGDGGATRLNPENDHRLFMALCIAAMRAGGKYAISDPGSVSVSYPGFIRDMVALGARITDAA